MQRYWSGKTKDGMFVSEALGTKWEDVYNNLSEINLTMEDKNIIINLPKNMDSYIQSKTASANFLNGEVQLESRNIGFVKGNNTITVRVDESSGNMQVETI